MTEKFEASNGVTIVSSSASEYPGYWSLRGKRGGIAVNTDEQQALREFFQQERDDRLGLWRFPKSVDYCVRELVTKNGREISVIHEPSGKAYAFSEGILATCAGSTTLDLDEYTRVALEWFEAHPLPKPWRDAKPGEVWVLTLEKEGEVGAVREYGPDFKLSLGTKMIPRDGRITAGRRIWPEDSDA